MTSRPTPGAPAVREPLIMPADLLPSQAAALQAELLARLRAADESVIELGEGAVSPTALQLLVATQRMAERDRIATRFGERARIALSRIGNSEKTGD